MIYFQSAEEESDAYNASAAYDASTSLFSFEDSTGQVIINLWIKLYVVIDGC